MLKFREINKKKFDFNYYGKKLFVKLIIASLLNTVLAIYSLLNNRITTISIPILSLILLSFYFNNQFKKIERQKVGFNIEQYLCSLNSFKTLLKQNGLWSKDQLEYLSKLIEEHKSSWKFSNTFFKLFLPFFSINIIPVILMALQWIYDNLTDLSYVILFTLIIVTLLLYIIGLTYMVYPAIKIYLDKDYSDLCSMQKLVQDILLLNIYKETE